MTDTPTTMQVTAHHPSVFIMEELEARGWSLDDLALRMGRDDFGVNRLSLDMYIEAGPTEPFMRIGEVSANRLAKAFGVSPEFFLNLEKAWLERQKP